MLVEVSASLGGDVHVRHRGVERVDDDTVYIRFEAGRLEEESEALCIIKEVDE